MRIQKILGFILATAFLIVNIYLTSVSGQYCDCEIPAAVRNSRLAIAEQAIRTAENQSGTVARRLLPFGLHRAPANADNGHLMIQPDWVTWYDDDLRMPLWVAYELTKADSLSKVATRQDCFRRDQRLEITNASFCADYDEPIFDRGHMVPANDNKRSQIAMDNSFLFSNMAPQFKNFNQGVWEALESKVHTWARTADGIYIITGAVFDRENNGSGNGRRDNDSAAPRVAPRNRVAIASHFYKIIIHRRPTGVIDTISFLLPHNNLSGTRNDNYISSKIHSIDEIEEVTGIDFFPDLDSIREENIEAGKASGLGNWFTY